MRNSYKRLHTMAATFIVDSILSHVVIGDGAPFAATGIVMGAMYRQSMVIMNKIFSHRPQDHVKFPIFE